MTIPLGVGSGVLAMTLLLVVFVALAEVSLATISRAHIRSLSEQGVPAAILADTLLRDAERFLAGVIVWRTIAIAAAIAAASWLALALKFSFATWVESMAGLSVLLLFLQVVGRMLAVRHPTGVALRVVRPLSWLLILAAPLTWLLLRLARSAGLDARNSTRSIFLTEDGLRLLLNFGEEEQFIEAEEREMIDSIFRFSETTVEEVMVPRVDVVALEVGATVQEALDIIVTAGHSRIPVFEETVDRVVGVLYAKDLSDLLPRRQD